jgi:hypothetical protein
MKYLKSFIKQLTFTLALIFSLNNYAQNTQSTYDIRVSVEDQDYVEQELRKGMVSFVESVKPLYRKGISYNDFIKVLIGENSTDMPVEGRNLLKKSYYYLSNEISNKEIERNDSMKEISAAFLYTLNYNSKNNNSDGEYSLFGLSNERMNLESKSFIDDIEDCKWWQIGCHLRNIRRISLNTLLLALNHLAQLGN